MGINFYRLTANVDYTLCLEILNTDYNLWDKSQISVDKGTSTGLTIGNVSGRKLSHSYSDIICCVSTRVKPTNARPYLENLFIMSRNVLFTRLVIPTPGVFGCRQVRKK